MLRLKRRAASRPFRIGLIALACIGFFYFLAPILAPFLAAAILAYILNPIVDWLEQHRVGRTLGTVLALLLVTAILILGLLIVLPMFYKESALLTEQVPGFIDQVKIQITPWVQEKFGFQINFDSDTIRQFVVDNFQDAKGIAQKILASLKIGGLAVAGFVINLVLVPVVLFYLLRDWNKLLASLEDMIPRARHATATALAREVDAILAEFLRGELSVMLMMSIFYITGLWVAGLQFALPIGLITGALVFVPYLGIVTGLLLATIAAFMQFHALPGVVGVWVVFALGQMLEGMVVTPWLVGDRIGLHPVAVLFALLAFGQVFGFFGVLLALPASAAILVGLRHLHTRYRSSALYRR